MFGFSNKKVVAENLAPPPGVAEIIFCIFDEKRAVHHLFRSVHDAGSEDNLFRFLNDPERAFESYVVREAIESRKPVSVSLSYAEGRRKYLHVMPYERRRGKWRFACVQVCTEPPDPDALESPCVCALAEERVCLLLADDQLMIRSASSKIPVAFGYSPDNLCGMNLIDLFSDMDMDIIGSCTSDTNESILSCVLHCLDGAKRDVQIKKYSAPDHCTLYAVCDVTQPQILEEVAQVSTRERRRIGQDLHDSIGQLLTGISLLSRSLANSLKRDNQPESADAAQISELADDASNQIRQISRGLMPSEIIQKGLFDSLRELARITSESCGLACEALIDETITFSDGAVETHLYRIAQESVNNAVRHAEATQIDIVLSMTGGMPQLLVGDNGTWKGARENLNGMGMKTMQYRATAIGAQLSIQHGPEAGTRVICRLETEELVATGI